MKAKITFLNKISQTVALLVSTNHAQIVFAKLASTNMIRHIDFTETLTKFHENSELTFIQIFLIKNRQRALTGINLKSSSMNLTEISIGLKFYSQPCSLQFLLEQ